MNYYIQVFEFGGIVMKFRLIIITKTKLLAITIVLAALLLFAFALRKISINTMNFYDPIYKGREDEKEI